MNKNKDFLSVLSDKYKEEFFADANGNIRRELDKTGILVLPNFLSTIALRKLQEEASSLKEKAYKSESVYNIYVLPEDKKFTTNSPRNRKFTTTKSCVPEDQIPKNSILRKIYNAGAFRGFISKVERLTQIFPYADKLSSININYYNSGDSLEWHFDNADFVITLLIKKPEEGGLYEYFSNIRYDDKGNEDYEKLSKILDGEIEPQRIVMNEGDLIIFRGNKSLHRVTNVEAGERILVTFNYNTKQGVPLSEKSRMTFFGRIE